MRGNVKWRSRLSVSKSLCVTSADGNETGREPGFRDADLAIAALVLRLGFGVLFLFLGLGKFLAGYGAWVERSGAAFEKTWLPAVLSGAFLHVLPFLEVALGALLLLGLFARVALVVAGFLLVALTFGVILRGDAGDAIRNVILIGAWAVAMAAHGFDRWSLDRRRR